MYVCMYVCMYIYDTTLLLQNYMNSIVFVLKILKWFKHVSGLEINKEKTNIVKVRASRDRSIPWPVKFGFKWATTFEIFILILTEWGK